MSEKASNNQFDSCATRAQAVQGSTNAGQACPSPNAPYNFGRIINLIEHKSRTLSAKAMKPFGISVSEMPFFLTLTQKSEVTQDELSTWVAVDKALTTRAVRSLEEKGLVERKRDQDDARKMRVALSPAGQAIADNVLMASVSFRNEYTQGIDPEDLKVAHEVLLKMADNLGCPAGREFLGFDKTRL